MDPWQTPKFKTLAELFTHIGPYGDVPRSTLPKMGNRKDSGRIGRYLARSHAAHQGFTAALTPGLTAWIQEHMLDIDHDTIHFEFIVWRLNDAGKADCNGKGAVTNVRVYAKYGQIIGSRLLADVTEAEFTALGVTLA